MTTFVVRTSTFGLNLTASIKLLSGTLVGERVEYAVHETQYCAPVRPFSPWCHWITIWRSFSHRLCAGRCEDANYLALGSGPCQLVGECYIDNLMNRQAVEAIKNARTHFCPSELSRNLELVSKKRNGSSRQGSGICIDQFEKQASEAFWEQYAVLRQSCIDIRRNRGTLIHMSGPDDVWSSPKKLVL